MSLMPFKGRCIHCGHDHGNSDLYGDDPIRYQERLKAQAMLEKVAVHVLEKQIATLTRQRDLAVGALENCRLLAARHRKEEWAGHIMRFCKDAGLSGSPIRNDSIKEGDVK